MDARLLSCVLALCVATALAWPVRAQEQPERGPAVRSISDDPAIATVSDLPDPRNEMFPNQAAAIAATYALEPWRAEDHCRAGWRAELRCRTAPSDTGHYCGYYVGGGAHWRGEGRYAHEGTWGWDYVGILVPRRVGLGWWHGKYQGGTGTYRTDGPKLRHE